MSRLVVFSLPPQCQVNDLRDHFKSLNVTITDARILYKQDGTSRRTAFLGFRSEAEATKAKDWANGSYLGGSKISIDYAKSVKDAPAPKNKRGKPEVVQEEDASSSKKLKTEETPKTTTSQKQDEKNKSSSSKSRFDEFLSLMRPKKNRLVSDENIVAPSKEQEKKSTATSNTEEANKTEDQVVENQDEPEKQHENDGAADDDELDDLAYMRKRMRKNLAGDEQPKWEQDDEQDDDKKEASDDNTKADQEKHDSKEEDQGEKVRDVHQENVDAIMNSSRLFLRNLPFTITEEELNEEFSSYGDVDDIHQPPNRPGLAYVRFTNANDAVKAYEALDGQFLQGRLLHILPAIDKNPKPAGPDQQNSVKGARADDKKKQAGKEWNWSSLYMNHDAVMDSIADRLKVSKAELLDPEAGGESVRLALAETSIIQETKKWLEDHGFGFSETSGKVKRSKTIIFVKNFPYGTTPSTIRSLFSTHGTVQRVLIPPAGTIAVVEMPDEKEAKVAFKSLAYHKIGSSIMYLEWAPDATSVDKSQQKTTAANDDGPVHKLEQDAPEGDKGATLFIKNLSFNTTNDSLQNVFQGLGDFVFARIQTKPDPKRPGNRLSMGFGFVGFRNVDSAENARKAMDGFNLDGHAIQVKFARQHQQTDVTDDSTTKASSSSSSSNSRTTKIMVKNVPFEASKKDIRQLFGAFGQLKSVRLPRKFDHTTRGFAFLEFISRQEAENAYKALQHTHLLGRHLVLQWTEETGDSVASLDALREKARRDVETAAGPSLQKKKIRDFETSVRPNQNEDPVEVQED